MKDEDVCAVDGASEAANVGIIHFTEVTMQLVKYDGLVQIAWRKVGGARRSEGHS